MPTKEELLRELAALRAENMALKEESSILFRRIPEEDEAYQCLLEGKIPALVKVKSLSYEKPKQPAITLIEGDNLASLVALQGAYFEKADVIYLDPPYNTGKDVYTYSDSYSTRLDKHSRWSSFIERRLSLARELLRDTGIIMCAIGVEELSHFKLILDRLFGERNLIANVTWSGSTINNARFVSTGSDYMLIYAKDIKAAKEASLRWRASKQSAKELVSKAKSLWVEADGDSAVATKALRKFYTTARAKEFFQTEPGLKMYNLIDNKGDLYRSSDLSSPSGHGGTYNVINPEIGKVVTLPARGWVHSEETFKQKIEDDEILWNGDGVPSYKRYLKDNLSVVLKDVIQRDRDLANKLLAKVIGRDKFSYPKDHNVLAEWIDYVTPQSRKDNEVDPPVIMDFFAGSGSTGHAVAQLNAADGGKRECLLVTTNEAGIAEEVTAERLKSLLSGEWKDGSHHSVLPGSFSYFTTEYLDPTEIKVSSRPLIPFGPEYIESVQKTVKSLKEQHLLF